MTPEAATSLRLAIEVLGVVSQDTLTFAEGILAKLGIACPEIELIRKAHVEAIARKDASSRPFSQERDRLAKELRARLAGLAEK